jgi:hypothetical protein
MAPAFILIAFVSVVVACYGLYRLKRSSGGTGALLLVVLCLALMGACLFLARLWWVALVVLVPVMVYALKMSKSGAGPWAGQLSGLTAGLLVALAALNFTSDLMAPGRQAAAARVMSNTEVRALAKGFVVGEFLAEKSPGANAVFVREASDRHAAKILEGVREGAKGSFTITEKLLGNAPAADAAAAEPGGTDLMVFIHKKFTTRDLRAIVAAHSKCDVLISTLAPPSGPSGNAASVKPWEFCSQLGGRFDWVLAEGALGVEVTDLTGGKVLAMVATDPGKMKNLNPTEKLPDNLRKAFDKTSLLITPENAAEIARKYPNVIRGD